MTTICLFVFVCFGFLSCTLSDGLPKYNCWDDKKNAAIPGCTCASILADEMKYLKANPISDYAVATCDKKGDFSPFKLTWIMGTRSGYCVDTKTGKANGIKPGPDLFAENPCAPTAEPKPAVKPKPAVLPVKKGGWGTR